ncbi:GAF domain-containing protein [Phycicoccus flavus]|uniref:GAF domain-containing protein n=1 Tax=Phycicoccus flavus TaxID=2502783 RepID=A0A8T6R8G0_9MICO|nr:GAF domain-containing protein [Phycicoccus flavus]NHA68491.1 GAF domain-containing protein [Phycicoccus flavus]
MALADLRVGPAHDVFSTLAGLAAGGAEAPVGVLSLGESDLVRCRARRGTGVHVPVGGTPRLRDVLAHLAATVQRLTLVDLGDIEWAADAGDPQLCGIAALAVVPVRQAGRVVGVVGAADTLSRPWSTDELAHLAEVATVVEHELATRARVSLAERVTRGWDTVATGIDGTSHAVSTLLHEVDGTPDVGLRARGALVRGSVDALTEDVLRLENVLAPGRDALADLSPTDLRVGVTAAVRAVAATPTGVRVRPRLHPEPVPVLAEDAGVRAGVVALLHAVTLAEGEEDVVVSLRLVPGSAEDVRGGPSARLVVDAPGRRCDVATLTAAVGRFESTVRRPGGAPGGEPPSLLVSGGVVMVRGRTVRARCDELGVRFLTAWGVDVG